MHDTSRFDTLLREPAKNLLTEFPSVDSERIVHAIARARLEVRSGHDICHLDENPEEAVTLVLHLARQELERATDTRTRWGQALNT